MTLREWRIEMQKCLLDVELIEGEKKSAIHLLPNSVRIKIENLGRDFITMQKTR